MNGTSATVVTLGVTFALVAGCAKKSGRVQTKLLSKKKVSKEDLADRRALDEIRNVRSIPLLWTMINRHHDHLGLALAKRRPQRRVGAITRRPRDPATGSTRPPPTTPPARRVAPPPPKPRGGTETVTQPGAAGRPFWKDELQYYRRRWAPYCARVCRHVKAICYAASRICQIARRLGEAAALRTCDRARRRCDDARRRAGARCRSCRR